jgi:protein gp37
VADKTAIEWTDATWSPWEGCTGISPGCDHCYAEAMNKWLRKGENWGPGAPRREYSEAHWRKPLQWNAKAAAAGKRMRVFPSVCDPFDNEVDPAWRARFFALISCTPHLDWLLLTKRIGNVAKMIEAPGMQKCGLPDNVWLGATVVNQEEADRDIPKLLATRARVRFLSIEPMLGPVNLDAALLECCGDLEYVDMGCYGSRPECCGEPVARGVLDWVICGGESGRGARPMSIQWARSLRDQCAAADVPFLFKQWGEWAPAGFHPAGEPGRFAFGDYEHDPAVFHRVDFYPRQFDKFGSRCTLERVGKKTAGRLLDGVEHNGFPEPAVMA